MVKGITLVTPVASAAALDSLASLFGALGFEPGKGWDDGTGRGAAFLAPLGNLEIMTGRAPAVPPILVEVTQLDQVRAAVAAVDACQLPHGRGCELLSAIEATHWNSRLFTVKLDEALKLGFWESENPLHGKPVAIEGDLSAAGMKFAIVVARWNAVITDRLLQGSLDALASQRRGARRTFRLCGCRARGRFLRRRGRWRSRSSTTRLLTLGCLLRGETAHYEAIYTEVARGIGQSQQETGVPHAFGVLTCETLEQALDRAGVKAGNKGFEAAIAAIEMVSHQQPQKTASGADGNKWAHGASPAN